MLRAKRGLVGSTRTTGLNQECLRKTLGTVTQFMGIKTVIAIGLRIFHFLGRIPISNRDATVKTGELEAFRCNLLFSTHDCKHSEWGGGGA